MSTEDKNKAGLVLSRSSPLSQSGATSLIRRGMQDLIAKAGAGQWLKNGQALLAEQRHEEAFACFIRSLELNPRQVELLCRLAHAYHVGDGVQEDDVKALALYRQAAEEGSVEGILCVGWHYACGYGVSLDNAEAARWWRTAAERGDAEAQHLLAMSYENGLGVSKDNGKAVQWYRKAANQGDSESREAIDRLLSKIDGTKR